MEITVHDVIDGKFTPNISLLATSICPPSHIQSIVSKLKTKNRNELQKEYTQTVIQINTHLVKNPYDLIIEKHNICELIAYEFLLSPRKMNSIKYLLHDISVAYVLMLQGKKVPKWLKEWWTRVESDLTKRLLSEKVIVLFELRPS